MRKKTEWIKIGRFQIPEEDFTILMLNRVPKRKLSSIINFDKLPKKQFQLMVKSVELELKKRFADTIEFMKEEKSVTNITVSAAVIRK